ncbi:MAG TPA: tryptophan--tRNA ligase [Candidatus Moranbacteria bacterium]|nr:tryptophan--tRNA ligase [Candidatus Moranbacteria bacterium]
MNSQKRIFSGIQPSGNLHIGNYLGAIKNWVKLQDEFESIFCVVDLHAITVPQDPEELRKKTLEIAKIYLASGINPKKSSIFIQSHVHEHTELTWILNTIAKMPELDKMTQFKDKTQKGGRESAGVGLYDYPVLMVADILLYDAEKVPVGEDQVQHVELTRTLGKRFNSRFGETFVIPEPFVVKEGMRIMALDDPTSKMSKSAASEYNYIALTDDADTIRKKIKKAVTDSGSEIKYEDDKPALKNLINIYCGFSDKTPKEIEKIYVGKGYGDFKNDLAEVVVASLKPIQEKMRALSDEEVLKILEDGASKVRQIAEKKMEEVKKKIGFIL